MCDRCCFSFQKALIYINGKDRQFYTHNLHSYMEISIVSHFLYIQLYDSPYLRPFCQLHKATVLSKG